jgi:hypothetical protein
MCKIRKGAKIWNPMFTRPCTVHWISLMLQLAVENDSRCGLGLSRAIAVCTGKNSELPRGRDFLDRWTGGSDWAEGGRRGGRGIIKSHPVCILLLPISALFLWTISLQTMRDLEV